MSALLQVLVHLDTDEANATMLQDSTGVELFKQDPATGNLISVIRCSTPPVDTNVKRKTKARYVVCSEARYSVMIRKVPLHPASRFSP